MSSQITEILSKLTNGSDSAADELLPIVYQELHALATHYLRRERADHTLQPTALVHEAYMKLVDQSSTSWKDSAHFCALAARAMRQVLVDHARKHNAQKRGAGLDRITLSDVVQVVGTDAVDLEALDLSMKRLAALDPRQSNVVELRFFGGLTAKEVAHILEISLSTVENDWRMARAWLRRDLSE